jgi:hypothetical protein
MTDRRPIFYYVPRAALHSAPHARPDGRTTSFYGAALKFWGPYLFSLYYGTALLRQETLPAFNA